MHPTDQFMLRWLQRRGKLEPHKRTPQQVCQGNPCWCGKHQDPSQPVPTPEGYQPYDAAKAEAFMNRRGPRKKVEPAAPTKAPSAWERVRRMFS